MKYAQIVLGLPVERAFTYSIPDNLQGAIKIGQRVQVAFGRRQQLMIGYVVGLVNQTGIKRVKPLRDILGQQPLLDKQMLQLTRQLADYYCAGWGEVIEASCPATVRKRKRAISDSYIRPPHLSPLPQGGEETMIKYPLQKVGVERESSPVALTAYQKQALSSIIKSVQSRSFQAFLLHGITASGKTEVYLQAIKEVLAQGRSSIVLVPEIALTSQTVQNFTLRFGERIAVMHSRLLASERARFWQGIKDGAVQIVIGARSAVFAPLENLGLIVVDEEHETTYKQKDSAPRYHAREVALLRAKLAKATVILGSATPSLESFYAARQGLRCRGSRNNSKIKLLTLPERVTKRDLPQVNIVDMRREIMIRGRRVNILSRVLELKIQQALRQGEQVIIFLNRRGFATFISCPQCGYTAKCKRCSISLTYHYATKTLNCHYCNFSIPPPEICPQCRSNYLRYFGLGTEKVESELHRLFPQARIARMDRDTTLKRDAHKRILGEFQEGKVNILIGTQMVAKGLDFPRVSLVGVISADTALNLPDFRSGERTFNLLTQVAGRSGRGEKEGQVVIQTYVPEHYAIAASVGHDYEQFYQREIESRQALRLPPFTHLVNLTLRGRSQERVRSLAAELSLRLKRSRPTKEIEVLGPAPAVVSRARGSFRWNVLLKGKRESSLAKLLRAVLKDFTRYKGMPLTIDVDPL